MSVLKIEIIDSICDRERKRENHRSSPNEKHILIGRYIISYAMPIRHVYDGRI